MSCIRTVFSTLRRYPSAFVGSILVSLLLIVALFAPMIAPHDPLKLNPKERFAPPSIEHVMGTDEYGRDMFSRIILGTRTSLGIGLSVSVICAEALADYTADREFHPALKISYSVLI